MPDTNSPSANRREALEGSPMPIARRGEQPPLLEVLQCPR
jgi:hypothetical protein